MKPKLSPRFKFVLAGILFVWLGSSVSYGQEAASYRDYVKSNENSELVSLASDLHPSIYLNDGEMKKYGGGAAVTLFTDVASIPLLYEADEAYSNVELITINIHSAEDDKAKISLAQLSMFTKLKYIVFIYRYDSCGENNETCLKAKTQEKISSGNIDGLQVFYLLSIPR